MTAPVDPTQKWGPGLLTIGATGTELDVSCLVNSATITASKDQGDSVTKLCGTVRTGVITYTYELGGNMDIDAIDPAGIFALSQTAKGTEVDFTYTPNDAGPTATGKLIIDPMDFGGDEYGAIMATDFAYALVDAPTYTWPTGGVESAGAGASESAVAAA